MFICSTLICGSPHPQHVGFAVTIVVGSLITIDAKRIKLKLSPFFSHFQTRRFPKRGPQNQIQVIRTGNTQILSAVFAHLFQLDPQNFRHGGEEEFRQLICPLLVGPLRHAHQHRFAVRHQDITSCRCAGQPPAIAELVHSSLG